MMCVKSTEFFFTELMLGGKPLKKAEWTLENAIRIVQHDLAQHVHVHVLDEGTRSHQ